MTFYNLISLNVISLFCTLIMYPISEAAKEVRCYSCQLGCADPAGYLQDCPGHNEAVWNATKEPSPTKGCVKCHLNETLVKEHEEFPESNDITIKDMKRYNLPKEYRSCGFSNGNKNVTIYYDANHNPIMPNVKYLCMFCDDSDGCNKPKSIGVSLPKMISDRISIINLGVKYLFIKNCLT